jgi:hypothetical protein
MRACEANRSFFVPSFALFFSFIRSSAIVLGDRDAANAPTDHPRKVHAPLMPIAKSVRSLVPILAGQNADICASLAVSRALHLTYVLVQKTADKESARTRQTLVGFASRRCDPASRGAHDCDSIASHLRRIFRSLSTLQGHA